MHVIDNSHNETRGGRVERDAGWDEKQLIKFAWPKEYPSSKIANKPDTSEQRECDHSFCRG